MWITFAIFMLVVFYICYKRLPFIQVHRLASLGYQLAGKRVDTSTAADDGAAILEQLRIAPRSEALPKDAGHSKRGRGGCRHSNDAVLFVCSVPHV